MHSVLYFFLSIEGRALKGMVVELEPRECMEDIAPRLPEDLCQSLVISGKELRLRTALLLHQQINIIDRSEGLAPQIDT